MKRILLLCIICVLGLNTVAQAQSASGKYEIYFFLSPTCPICKFYCKYMRELSGSIDTTQYHITGLIPGKQFSSSEIAEFKSRFQLPFDVIADSTGKHEKLNASITPEVFVVSASGEVKYHGRIDDAYLRIGKKRTIIKNHELDNALNELRTGKQVSVSFVPAVGCIIEK